MRIDEHSIAKGSFTIYAHSGEVPHRAWIIMYVAELESLLGNRFITWLASHNPSADLAKAKVDLIDGAILGSLTKLADMSYYLNLIGPKMLHDLRKLAKLRDRYAHDFPRGQLDTDLEMFKFVQDTHLYKENRARLLEIRELPEQTAFIAVAEQLKASIQNSVVE